LLRDLRNTDALENITTYLKERKDELQRVRESDGNIWDVISLDTLLSMYPVRKISNYAYQNKGELNFEKITKDWGLDDPGFSTGASYGDLDNDGDLDLIVSNVNDRVFIYENKVSGTNSLRVVLEPSQAEVLMGSKVEISIGDKKQIYEFSNSRGFYSSSEPIAHFGIGESTKVDKVDVYWSNGSFSQLTDVAAGTIRVKSNSTETKNNVDVSIDPYFVEYSELDISHLENEFDDFEREVLLPHKMSTEGPLIAIGDIDGDKTDEIYLPGPIGFEGILEGSINEKLVDGKDREEVAALFFDADNDRDLDMYVVTGGNEFESGDAAYQDIFFENQDGSLKQKDVLPQNYFSGSIVINADFDQDGDEDLFIGGRQIPGKYPSMASSFIYKNLFSETGTQSFEDVTSSIAPELENIGMITDAIWSDFDSDKDQDLILVGEWTGILIFENINGKLSRRNSELEQQTGWWNHINSIDLDDDGDEDYVVGNLGLNYKFTATESEPFVVYYDDFDQNGMYDIVLGYYNFGELYPVRGRSCSSQQIPEIKSKFKNYDAFASANIFQVYGEQALNKSLTLEAVNFNNSFIENLGGGKFKISSFPNITQLSPINSTVFYDVNQDGLMDIIYAGNKYGSEVETPRADAGIGGVLINLGGMKFEHIDPSTSGLFLNNHVKDLKIIRRDKKDYLLVASNNDRLRLFESSTK
jgi:hypothetical protein